MTASPESELAALKSKAQQAQTEYQRSLARIESKREEAKTAALALKEFGVTSLADAELLVSQLEGEVAQALAEAREVLG